MAAALVALGAFPARGAGILDVLSYNVAGLPQGISSSNPVVNTPQMSPLLNDWDLVLVQEDFWYHDDLLSQDQHPYRSAKDGSIRPGTGFPGLPLGDGLNRFSRSPFSGHTRQMWADCFGVFSNSSDCLAPKGFSMARHEVSPGLFLDVYNWHADAGGAPEDDAARRANVRQMAAFIALASAGRAVLVMGDTNSRYTDAGDILPELLDGAGLSDVWVETVRAGARPPVGPRLDACSSATYESAGCESIDKIFYRSGGGLLLEPLDYQVENERFVDAAGVPLSDHHPVSARFAFRAVPEPGALLWVAALALGFRPPAALRRRR